VSTFDALAILLALFMLARHGRQALRLLWPGRDPSPGGRAAGVVPLLVCLVALAVLLAVARRLLAAGGGRG
jgi:hypothetical protein